MALLFVGEKRSQRAIDLGYSWDDGRLAGCTLLAALEACGYSRTIRDFKIVNAYLDNGSENTQARDLARTLHGKGWLVIGMGHAAQHMLDVWRVPYRPMIHPAARGAIRKRERYHAHVRAVLSHQYEGGPHAPYSSPGPRL